MTRWFLILLTSGSLAASGCSMALSGPSADRPRGRPPQCDTSKGLVVADALLASTLGIVAVSVASNNGGEAILPLIGAGVFVASAVHGNNVVNACHRELANYDSEMASARPLPPNPDAEAMGAPRPMVAMQPVTAPQTQPQSAQLHPQSAQPQPLSAQPEPQSAQPQPQPQPPPPSPRPAPSSSEPWAAFWKEAP